jgi:hypothetical protein
MSQASASLPWRRRWLLTAFLFAVGWNPLWFFADSFELTNYLYVSGPLWIRRLSSWSPQMIGARFTHALGFRWSFVPEASNWQIMMIVDLVDVGGLDQFGLRSGATLPSRQRLASS